MAEGGKSRSDDIKDLDDLVSVALGREGGVTTDDFRNLTDRFGALLHNFLSKDRQQDLIDPIVEEVNEAFKSLITHPTDFKFTVIKNDLEPGMSLPVFSLGIITIFPQLTKTISLSKPIFLEKDARRMHLLMMDLYEVVKNHLELHGDFDTFDGCGHLFDDPNDPAPHFDNIDRARIYLHSEITNDLQYGEVGGRSRIISTGSFGENFRFCCC